MRWFRIAAAGRIAGLCDMDEESALLNLGKGEFLVPFDPTVSPRDHRWTPEGWAALPAAPERTEDWSFMRGTGYPPVGEQLGAVMKVLADPADPEARRELDSLLDQIAAVKAAHPKPATGV